MPNIVELIDFTGEYQIAYGTFTEDKFNVIRDPSEKSAVYQLLGATLGALFLADLDANGVPVSARFTALYNAFAYDDGCKIVESKGMKDYVKGIVWIDYVKQNPINVGTAGNTLAKSENADNANDIIWQIRVYNNSISQGRAIQMYIVDNSSNYTEFNGQQLKYMSYV